ncbi:MAG: YdcF family protein [Candidatus Saccharimonadales bacterium]
MNKNADDLAQTIWDYMLMNQSIEKADIIIGFGSHDKRTAKWVAQLYLDGYAPTILFCGNEGHGRKISGFDGIPEAETYKAEAIRLGVPESDIKTESKSTNTGENIQFAAQFIDETKIEVKKAIIVHKPYMERRTYATIKAQWPAPQPEFIMSSVPITYEEYITDPLYPRDYMMNVMVGDLQRIIEYPKLGFQVSQQVPDNIVAAMNELIKLGYDKNLIES